MAKRDRGAAGSWRVVERGAAWRDADAAALRDPDALLTSAAAWPLKRPDAGRAVGLVVAGDRSVVVKVYDESGARGMLERLLVGSPAARAARGRARMAAAGFAVPDLVAVMETALRVPDRRSALVTAAVLGERADWYWEGLSRRDRRRFAQHLGAYVRAVHAQGLYPQDMRISNVVVMPTGAAVTLVLVDLDRVRRHRRLAWRRRLKNLVQIDRSLGRLARASERLSFLHSYLGPVGRVAVRDAARAVVVAGRHKDATRPTRVRDGPRRRRPPQREPKNAL